MQCKAEDIVAIIDMDGFQVGKKFLCKELGVIKIGDIKAKSFFFDIDVEWGALTLKEKKTCGFVQKYIHKLPFGVPRDTKAFHISNLEANVQYFYDEVRKNSDSIIAYKGGHFEKDLLMKLNIPSMNLEDLGCPKAERLYDQLMWLETCGNHLTSNAYHHCAKVEVEAYAMWLQQQL